MATIGFALTRAALIGAVLMLSVLMRPALMLLQEMRPVLIGAVLIEAVRMDFTLFISCPNSFDVFLLQEF
jgi:hypothetical protein